jgi:pyruvate/2-oxoglutarate/acetoin dehydrogenase E1 component
VSAVRDCSFNIFASSEARGWGLGSEAQKYEEEKFISMHGAPTSLVGANQASAPPSKSFEKIQFQKKKEIYSVLTSQMKIIFLDIIFSFLNILVR